MRFWNSGKHTYEAGRSKETGEMVTRVAVNKVKGQNPGACIVNHASFKAVVEEGEWVDIPDGLFVEEPSLPRHMHLTPEQRAEQFAAIVKRQCPCLLTEDEAKAEGVSIEPKRGPGRPPKLKE